MLKKYCVLSLILLMFGAANVGAVSAVSNTENQDSAAEKIKAAVGKIGTGEKARATVTLRDGRKLSGYISAARTMILL